LGFNYDRVTRTAHCESAYNIHIQTIITSFDQLITMGEGVPRFIMPSDSEDEDERRVHFGEVTYITIPIDRAHRDARCGTWVIDRVRFHHRILETAKQIGWIFCPRHHDIVYNSRHT
jgi:hypothetical protein